jgi:hypothetical protein
MREERVCLTKLWTGVKVNGSEIFLLPLLSTFWLALWRGKPLPFDEQALIQISMEVFVDCLLLARVVRIPQGLI